MGPFVHGAASRRSLLQDESDAALRRELRARRVRREYRGVYVDVRHDYDRLARLGSALLRAGAGAHLSHQTAAELHGLGPDSTASVPTIHISVPHRRRPRPAPGLVLHRPAVLSSADQDRLDDLAVTGIERTLLDLSGLAGGTERALALVTDAVRERRTTAELLEACLERSRHIRGTRQLAVILSELAPGFESVIEVTLSGWCLAAGLQARPQVTVVLPGGRRYRLDLFDDALLLAIEADGAAHHLSVADRERDLRRDDELRSVGIETVRFTGRQIQQDSSEVIRRLYLVAEQRRQSRLQLRPGVVLMD
jgi:very-short-patch-repair endonuclease